MRYIMRHALFATGLFVALMTMQACGGSSSKVGCVGNEGCKAGNSCVNGECVAADAQGDLGQPDTSQPDDTSTDDALPNDSLSETVGGEDGVQANCTKEGEIVCNSGMTAYKKCIAGEWRDFECPTTPCEANPGLFNTGTKPGICDNGVGCLLTSCEACPGNFAVDLTSSVCHTTCNDENNAPQNSRCWPGYNCIDGKCTLESSKLPGQKCEDDNECQSGYCVRTVVNGTPDPKTKVCCAAECKGTCTYCGNDGQCKTQDPGKPDPENCTTQDVSTCGTTGNCNAKGECETWAENTVCSPSKCETDTQYGVSTCIGGKCTAPTGVSCEGKGCKAGLICDGQSCVAHNDCTNLGTGWFCQKDPTDGNKGICARKRDDLASCDGLVFPSDPDGDNTGCKSGLCAPDNFEGHGPSFICVPAGSCNWLGQQSLPGDTIRCNGNDFSMKCSVKAWGSKTVCNPGPCVAIDAIANSGFREKKCVDAKGCDDTCTPCSGGFLADVAGCKKECGADTDCVDSHYCDDSTKLCRRKKSDGVECTDSKQCANGACVESADDSTKVCCSSDCSGKCNFCGENTEGKWVCKIRDAGTLDSFCTANNTGNVTCGVSTCTGKDELCGFPDLNTACPPDPNKPQVCENGALHRWRCDGKGGCEKFEFSTCDNGCNDDGTSCKSACTSHSDCEASDSNTFCSSSGKCLPKLADGQNCTNNSFSAADRNPVCKSGSCSKDTLATTDALGTVTNHSGAYYCRPQGSCIDATAKDAPTADIRAKNYFVCDGKYDGTKKGVRTLICNGTTWVAPSTAASVQPDYCDVSTLRKLNKYPGDGTKNSAGYYPGYLETVCYNGVIGSGGKSTPGCSTLKKSCGAYMHQGGSNTKCFGQDCTSTIEICIKFCGGDICDPKLDPKKPIQPLAPPICEFDCCKFGTETINDSNKCSRPTYTCKAGKCAP